MYSPRSVSTGSMPAAESRALSSSSSDTIDLPLTTDFAPYFRQISRKLEAASSAVCAHSTWPPRAMNSRSKRTSSSSRCSIENFLIACARSRRSSQAICDCASCLCSTARRIVDSSTAGALGLCRSSWTCLRSKWMVIRARRSSARQHFGEVERPDVRAAVLEHAADVHEAARVAGDEIIRARHEHVRALRRSHRGRELVELDAEQAAETAAFLDRRELAVVDAA